MHQNCLLHSASQQTCKCFQFLGEIKPNCYWYHRQKRKHYGAWTLTGISRKHVSNEMSFIARNARLDKHAGLCGNRLFSAKKPATKREGYLRLSPMGAHFGKHIRFSNCQFSAAKSSQNLVLLASNMQQCVLTRGVSAPPTMVMPRLGLVRGISTCDTSPSSTGKRVMPERKEQQMLD